MLQAWRVKLCKNQKKATYFKNMTVLDQSALKKLTEEPLPTKKVRKRFWQRKSVQVFEHCI